MRAQQVYEGQRHRMCHCTGKGVQKDRGAGELAACTSMEGAEGSVTKVPGGYVKGCNEELIC
jgi:hypothetical protein